MTRGASILWLWRHRFWAWVQSLLFGEPFRPVPHHTVWRIERWHDGQKWVVYAHRGQIVLGTGYAVELRDACLLARLEVRRTIRRRTHDTTAAARRFAEQNRKDA